MASCHSLTHINNELAGDLLGLKFLNSLNGLDNENTLFDCLTPTIVIKIKSLIRESCENFSKTKIKIRIKEESNLLEIEYP